jgi:conjugative transposon TraJ protein
MKKSLGLAVILAGIAMLLPHLSFAGALDDEVQSLHTVLDNVRKDMVPQLEQLTNVARAIAGFAALWYIAARVWRHIANAESIDFYPLLRPFAIGLAIMNFSSLIALADGILEPTVDGTNALVSNSNQAIEVLIKQKEDALQGSTAWKAYVGDAGTGDRAEWYKLTHPDDPTGSGEKWYESIGNSMRFSWDKMMYNAKNQIKLFLSEVLTVLFAAASLAINTIRTFYLIVLAIIGPLVFAFATFDGLTSGIANWVGRYINVFLWLPVCNIFSAIIGQIQQNMLKIDIQQIKEYGDSFFSTADTAYLVFMIIAIVGYTTVPGVANYIVQASGASSILRKVTNMAGGAASSMGGFAASGVGGAASGMLAAPYHVAKGYMSGGSQMDSSLTSGLGAAAGRAMMADAQESQKNKIKGEEPAKTAS